MIVGLALMIWSMVTDDCALATYTVHAQMIIDHALMTLTGKYDEKQMVQICWADTVPVTFWTDLVNEQIELTPMHCDWKMVLLVQVVLEWPVGSSGQKVSKL